VRGTFVLAGSAVADVTGAKRVGAAAVCGELPGSARKREMVPSGSDQIQMLACAGNAIARAAKNARSTPDSGRGFMSEGRSPPDCDDLDIVLLPVGQLGLTFVGG
jgi:hypothetical protein